MATCGRSWKILSISRWKEQGAPVNPKDIHLNWTRPIPGPGQMSSYDGHLCGLASASIHFEDQVYWKWQIQPGASLKVFLLSSWQSTHILSSPVFFLTNTAGAFQELLLSSMMPCSDISRSWNIVTGYWGRTRYSLEQVLISLNYCCQRWTWAFRELTTWHCTFICSWPSTADTWISALCTGWNIGGNVDTCATSDMGMSCILFSTLAGFFVRCEGCMYHLVTKGYSSVKLLPYLSQDSLSTYVIECILCIHLEWWWPSLDCVVNRDGLT